MKKIQVNGIECNENGATMKPLQCIVSNDEIGKSLSINNGKIQFTIPLEPIEKYLKGGAE